jgi:hypothetical protein
MTLAIVREAKSYRAARRNQKRQGSRQRGCIWEKPPRAGNRHSHPHTHENARRRLQIKRGLLRVSP